MRDLFSAAGTLGDPPYEAIAQGAVLLRGSPCRSPPTF